MINLRKFALHIFLALLVIFIPIKYALSITKDLQFNLDQKLTSLHAKAPELNKKVLELALNSYQKVNYQKLNKKHILTVIDYSLPSSQKRMWVFNIDNNKVLFHNLVAHGKGSGDLYATRFSNTPGTQASSLGTFITKGSYSSGHIIYGMRLDGIENGYNDKSLQRGVVMHSAWYVSDDFLKQNHRLGRSWGCPAISEKLAKPIIDTIKNGSVLFTYYPDKDWLSHSKYV